MLHVDLLALIFIFKEGIVIGGIALVIIQKISRRLAACFPRLFRCGDMRETCMSRLTKAYYNKFETASFIVDYVADTAYLTFVMAKNMSVSGQSVCLLGNTLLSQ